VSAGGGSSFGRKGPNRYLPATVRDDGGNTLRREHTEFSDFSQRPGIAEEIFIDIEFQYRILAFTEMTCYTLLHMSDDTFTEKQENIYPAEASREMIEAGVFYGRKKSKTNPKMRKFILANRGGIEIINLDKTNEGLEKATAFIKEKVRNGGMPLFVGTSPAAEASVEKIAKEFSLPYVTLRWVGGTLTNFKIISRRVEYFKKLRSDLASGMLEKYTKKERLEMEHEVKRLEELMGGLETMPREPDFLVVIDPNMHTTAVREAKVKRIPIVALANVDADPDVIDYLVPGNDKARMSVAWFLANVEKAIREGVAERSAAKAQEVKAEK
jgi:small subunit ribosomal protein S2